MSPLSTYTTLTIPRVSSCPSVTCLQWSGDGQAFFVTKTSVYILTPEYGISSSFIKTPVAFEKPLGWFRTMIEFNNRDVHNWPDGSQEWGAAALGSLDTSLQAVACSPSNITDNAGCVLAVLSSNMDLSLWAAVKNSLHGEWIKIHEVTSFLADLYWQEEDKSATARTLQAQVTSITWSCQADFGIVPAPSLDGSLLVAGNRAGALIFLRFDGKSTIRRVATLNVGNNWPTHLAFSPWTLVETGRCEAHVAYGASDGSIGLLKIIQSLELIESISAFGPEYTINTQLEDQSQKAFNPDTRGITALAWITSGENIILVSCKPGMVHLWSQDPRTMSWSRSRAMRLQTQKLSVGSSSLQPVSGLHYIRQKDALIISLFDGSLHVIHDLSREPSWNPSTTDDDLTSQKVSEVSRSLFTQAELGSTGNADVNRISGLISYDGYSTVFWAHEACRPADCSYKYDAGHNAMLVVAQLWDHANNDSFLRELAEILNTAKAASGDTTLHLLRPFLLRLQHFPELHPHALEILRFQSTNYLAGVVIFPWSDQLGPESRHQFRRSLTKHLFGWDVLLSLRMRLLLADFSWKFSKIPRTQTECGDIANSLLQVISQIVLLTVVRHLGVVVAALTPNDVPFIVRIAIQSSCPGSHPDLSMEARNLLDNVHAAVPLTTSRQTSIALASNEPCPACGVQIAFEGGTNAICPNGHSWSRCSITSFVMSTTMVRTCIGCNRKAFLPRSSKIPSGTENWLPRVAQSWVVEEFLEAVHRCLFCGNGFVSIL